MFGIGLPEMILILAIALIVVGPDKLPDLARSSAKWLLELKKMAETLKKDLTEDGTLDAIKSDLKLEHKNNLFESSDQSWKTLTPGEGVNPAPDKTGDNIIEAELTVINDAQAASPASPTDNQAGDRISETEITVVDAPKPAPPIDDQAGDKISETPAPNSPEKDTNTHPAC
jgi:sec-independent protein translocase protein TatB